MRYSGLTHQDDHETLSQNSRRLKKDRKSSREMVDKYIGAHEGEKRERVCFSCPYGETEAKRSIIAGSQIFQMLNTINSNRQEI